MLFYFDIYDGADTAPDNIGVELSDDVAARLQATIALTDIARKIVPKDEKYRNLIIKVRTEEGARFQMSLDYALAKSRAGSRSRGPRG